MPTRPREWIFLAVTLAVAAGCIRLGFWQLDRLQQRRQRNAQAEARLALPPVELPESGETGDQLADRRVIARGRFDPRYEVLLSPRSLDGRAGAHLVTPLLLAGAQTAILVDRGWIPADAAAVDGLVRYAVEGEVEIRGFLRSPPAEPAWGLLSDATPAPGGPRRETWRLLNIESLQRQTPYPLHAYYIVQTEPLPGGQPVADPGLDLSEGPHLGYAIQWFSFAAIAVGGGAVWFHRRAAG